MERANYWFIATEILITSTSFSSYLKEDTHSWKKIKISMGSSPPTLLYSFENRNLDQFMKNSIIPVFGQFQLLLKQSLAIAIQI